MEDHHFEPQFRAYNRQGVWTAVSHDLSYSQKVLYLEFGVARGDSMRWWSRHLLQPDTRLHGFDSFEGLPEEGGPWAKGQFAVDGQLPIIHDDRVQFFKGWFHEALPRYEPPEHETLLMNIDADLYSSTSYVLRCMRPYIGKRSFIYFDEFNQPEHEQRAFDEFLHESRLPFRLMATDWTMAFSLFECLG
jgi:O-methyltransferase